MPTAVKLDFKEPTIKDAEWAAPILYKNSSNICEHSFTTIWMWRKYYNNQIARYEDSIFVRSGDVEPLYLIPVGGDLKRNIQILKDYQHERGEFLTIFGANAEVKKQIDQWFPGQFEWRPSEADFDYIYNTEDLALLKGRKYHSKRNHIASFSSSYDWSYEPISPDNADEVYQMVIEWCKERGNCSDPGLRNERLAIGEALKNMKALNLIGGLIRVSNKVV
ncbi:MAG TPA: phosphatidylglycerol lysyltransferase domain-containing protein, partial [Candidatus Avimonas sp.]|nr:phosphatidylglycerol lysyltransferase domain-containing protein [Candidatus Avimonas sp.]